MYKVDIIEYFCSSSYNIPFDFHDIVYYVYCGYRIFGREKWKIRKCSIEGIWATNCVGVILDNGYHVSEHNFDRLFKHREDAIMFYLEKQKMSKVKIRNENGLECIEAEKRIKEKRHKEEQEDK